MESDYVEKFEWKGRLYTVKELADIAGIHERAMNRRLDRFKTMDEVMSVEPQAPRLRKLPEKDRIRNKLWLFEGSYYTASELARATGINRKTMWQRLRLFGNADEAVNRPYNRKAKGNITAMLEAGGISKSAFYDAVKKGVTLGEFFGVK